MKIKKSTRRYEEWLSSQLDVVEADLALKHQLMAHDAFRFLRATFYRWAETFIELCPDLASASKVLAVGDLHIENFGTWRDAEGRLAWGVNDFDEAARIPWPNDLVRLATSAHMAVRDSGLALDPADACDAVLEGYARGLASGGRAFVLDEDHRWLHDIAHNELRDPQHFWKKIDALRPLPPGRVDRAVLARLRRALPAPDLDCVVARRVAGVGSLGRPRFVAVARWHEARVARETKPLLPSAWCLAAGGRKDAAIRYRRVVDAAVRAPDPCLTVDSGWVVRRLSPSCSRIELADLPRRRDERRLVEAMGAETANIHLGTTGARKAISAELGRRKKGWLHEASARMRDAVESDFRAWVDFHGEEPPLPRRGDDTTPRRR
jgi:hypothetical protein